MRVIRILLGLAMILVASVAKGQVAGNEETLDYADMPVIKPYFLQYQYLSILTPMVREGDGFIFTNHEILKSVSVITDGFRLPFCDDEIAVDSVAVGAMVVYVWQLAEPEYLREALYLAFVPVDGAYKAYVGCIDKPTQLANETYGCIKRPATARECVEQLIQHGPLTRRITPGQFWMGLQRC